MCAHGREREGEKDKFTSIYQSALEDDRDCKEMATSSMYEDVHMYESNAYKFIRTAPKGHKMMIPNTPKIDIDNNNNDVMALWFPPDGYETVYIGESKRRFVIKGIHLHHPLFKALWDRSRFLGVDQSLVPSLGCEVVLFEHLLWMLDTSPLPSVDHHCIYELAELYIPSYYND